MIFDENLNKGVQRKCLHDPNPQSLHATIGYTRDSVVKGKRAVFFEEFQIDDPQALSLCNTQVGGPIPAESRWSLRDFYDKNGLQPSRYKLYVVLKLVRDIL